MHIERDGKRYELTKQEMYDTYHEVELEWDKEDIIDWLTGDNSNEEILTKLQSDEEFFNRVATRYRYYMNGYADTSDAEWTCFTEAYDWCEHD